MEKEIREELWKLLVPQFANKTNLVSYLTANQILLNRRNILLIILIFCYNLLQRKTYFIIRRTFRQDDRKKVG